MSKVSRETFLKNKERNLRMGLSAKVLQGLLSSAKEPKEAGEAMVADAVRLADLLIMEVDSTTPKEEEEVVGAESS